MISDVQPGIVSPMAYLSSETPLKAMADSMQSMLISPAKRRGAALHAVMPFQAKETIFQKGYLLSPAMRL